MAERDHIPGNTRDNFTLLCIWYVSLDVMMNMETSAVLDIFWRLQGDYQDSTPSFRIKRPVSVIRTNKVKDKVCMRVALIALNTSLHADKYTENIQYDMMGKTPTWYTNVFEAGEEYRAGEIYSSNGKKVYEASAPAASC